MCVCVCDSQEREGSIGVGMGIIEDGEGDLATVCGGAGRGWRAALLPVPLSLC